MCSVCDVCVWYMFGVLVCVHCALCACGHSSSLERGSVGTALARCQETVWVGVGPDGGVMVGI